MEYIRDIEELYQNIGYTFKKDTYLKRALTHSSYSNELRAKNVTAECNERLEFLGDSVLSILVSEYLFFKYPGEPEGNLTKIRAAVVCEDTLCLLAKEIELGSFMFLGRGEDQNGGRERKSLLADAFEALLAAIYIDGGYHAARTFLFARILPYIEQHVSSESNTDYKTKLQQFVQAIPGEVLEYVLTDEQGPNHDKEFFMEARLDNNVIGRGRGKSKRAAEQMAAYEALVLFGEIKEQTGEEGDKA